MFIKQNFLAHFEPLLGNMTWTLSGLVEAETPTTAKEAIDELAEWMAVWASDLGAKIVVHEQKAVGNFVECHWNRDAAGKRILICCHLDTVHPLGSVDERPTRIEGDTLYGVGSYDMKGGIAIVQTVIQELVAQGELPQRPITLLLTSDEEIGSPHSRHVIEDLAKEACLVLVMEPAPSPHQVVTERKGVGVFQMVALGRASHSGSDPDAGVNAIVEMAHQTSKIVSLANRQLGTTIEPTVIRGGTAHNVIPEECDITINVRVRYKSEAERISRALYAIAQETLLPDSLLYVTGGFTRPPMEHTPITEAVMETLHNISPIPLEEFAKGGGSDGNFTAALGIPTLDGLGPSGGGAHSEDEHVYLPSLPQRAALLAAILCEWPTD